MIPENRFHNNSFSIPKLLIEKEDINLFIEEFKGFHAQFADCFSREEPRENFYQYMAGQMSQLERKSIEPIALNVENAKVRAMQHFLSDIEWHEDLILTRYRDMVSEDMGDEDGVLIFDESGFVKKGNDSVGVFRQYCGSIGKVENCQVGVYAAYASRHGYAFLDSRLFIPEKWFGEDYAERRKKCRLPDEICFKTKPQLAVEMLEHIVCEGALSFRYITADSIYGNSPEFIDAAERVPGAIYFVALPSDTLCWMQNPATIEKTYRYAGEQRTKWILSETTDKPSTFEKIAKGTNDYFWYRRTVSEGAKGPIAYEFMKRRVVLAKDGKPDRTVWLIVRRTIGEAHNYSYFISNAGISTRLKTFVWISGVRWAIEQCFEEAKSDLGMDHYEVRKFPGWRHHMITCMLAHFFLWHMRIKLGKKSASYYAVAA
ncbi:MAG: IS701 family transposase [Deltaproteobacteria bacterium]|nr:IS701 family transposase [Deltaproteobacteria bacterium]